MSDKQSIVAVIFLIIVVLTTFFKSNLPTSANFNNSLSNPIQNLSKNQFLSLNPQMQNKYIEDFAAQKGVEKAWEFITNVYQGNQFGIGSAHDLAHLVGGLIYQNKGFAGLSVCTPVLAFGCYHGFLDQAFITDTKNLPAAESACNKLGVINSGPVASCIHGIGHGLASFYQTRNLEGSLKECDRLINGQIFCYDGVFMEFSRSAPPNFYSKDDPLEPCDKLPPIYASSCGRNQSQVMMQRLQLSFTEVVQRCAVSTNTNFKDACFDSLGFFAVSANSGVVQHISSLCQSTENSQFADHCLRSAAGELIFQNVPNWQTNSLAICQQVSQENIEDCQNYLKNIASQYNRF